jgi:hypothetical protein
MRLVAALTLVGVVVLVVLAVIGTLPWWGGAFPLMIAWVSLTNLVMYWLGRRTIAG